MRQSALPASNLLQPRLPQVVEQLLKRLGITARVVHETPGSSQPRVQAALLEDAVGTLLVLFPHDQLLDLNRLKAVTGRTLTAAGAARLQQLIGHQRLSALPGLPALTGVPCLYDERLLHGQTLLLDSGRPHVLLEIDTETYRGLLDQASAARFGIPLRRLRLNLKRPPDDPMEAVQGFTARRIRQRLERRVEIPPLQKTAQKILELREHAHLCADDITDLVETDPALAAQVVSWAGLAFGAEDPAPQRILSVEDAIVRVLGFDLVLNLSLGLSRDKPAESPELQEIMTPYWEQAIYTATLMEGLCRAIPRPQRPEPGLAYLAGLLHNFGYLILAHIFPPHFRLLSQHLQVNPHVPHGLVEHHLLGITREQIGAWLMEHWKMPEELAVALLHQDDPQYRDRHAVYANLIYLAVNLLRNRGIGSGPQEAIPQALLERLELSRAKAEEALDRVLAAETALRMLLAQP